MAIFDNLCNSCTNIGCEFQFGIIRTECDFYMPSHLEPNSCVNFVVIQPTVEAIPKDQYESRLKADMTAMLTDIQLECEENTVRWYVGRVDGKSDDVVLIDTLNEIIQQKINALRGNNNDNN